MTIPPKSQKPEAQKPEPQKQPGNHHDNHAQHAQNPTSADQTDDRLIRAGQIAARAARTTLAHSTAAGPRSRARRVLAAVQRLETAE